MAGGFTGNPQQIFLQNPGLTVGNNQRGGFANFLNRSGVLPQPFQFRQKYAQSFGADRDVRAANGFNGLAKGESVSKRGRRREPFRNEQDLVNGFAFGEFLDGSPFVEQARR